MLKRHLITNHKISGTGTFSKLEINGIYNSDIGEYDVINFTQDAVLINFTKGDNEGDVTFVGALGKGVGLYLWADMGVDGSGGQSPTLQLYANYADSTANFITDSPLNIITNFDSDDFIQIQTISHVPEITTVGNCDLKLSASSGRIGMGLTPTANMAGLSIEAGLLTLKETTTPTADINYGKIYTKTDNKLYFQDGAGSEHEIKYA